MGMLGVAMAVVTGLAKVGFDEVEDEGDWWLPSYSPKSKRASRSTLFWPEADIVLCVSACRGSLLMMATRVRYVIELALLVGITAEVDGESVSGLFWCERQKVDVRIKRNVRNRRSRELKSS